MSVSTAAERAAPPRWPDGFFTVRDGTRLHYVEAGQGVPVILIHGARGSAIGNWFSNGIAPKLAQTNHVYALDMRAHGLSGGARHSHFNMADDVLEFMDQMGIRKAHIAGYSMGGGVTLQLLARAPERFITACFQGSGISEVGEWKDKVPPDITGEAPDEAAANAQAKARRQAKGEEVGNDLGDRIRAKVQAVAGEGAVRKMEDMAGRMMATLTKLDLSRINFPVMAINGEYDRPNARTHRMARELADFTNLVLPGKGHLSAMMAGFIPDEYVEGYAAFVARNDPPEADRKGM
ncbi:alpha/beta hydrolase [Phenylobacterium sp. 20VBR1]|uniref:Alpha/beta hydrolase n=1 Tax=Phenylobacterium glaciei TaxID=2803784 RepID=A0A941D4H7_9CAUL|nr:alpha/beta hydrolase [Phenylobacterium glaciei]MBR7620726.1 alpha/beta hydrolase [Phenylobacterium glaciei]